MPLPQTGSLAPGTVIADCRIERLLGVGGMGEVYLATHLRLDKLVALKILPGRSVGDPDAVTRFVREAKLAAKINHANVIKILDVNHRGNDHYILMDYVEGSNLSEVVKKLEGPLPFRQALRLVQLAARGTAAVHELGLIHRDIKPANIMLTTKKNVILMDFGLVREQGSSEVTSAGAVLGTPAFMSPEQARGDPLDARSDVFSLGSTLYYLLTAKLPFEGSQIDVLIQLQQGRPPRSVSEVNPYVPRPVADFVRRVMAPRREDRPRSAAVLASEIKPLLDLAKGSQPIDQTDTADGSGLKTGPFNRPNDDLDLVPLETVRESSFLEKARPYLPWFTVAAVVLSVVVIVLALRGGRSKETASTANKDVAPAKPEVPKAAERPGMILIPAGPVQIGNTEDELSNQFRTVPMKLNGVQITRQAFLALSIYPPRTEQVAAFWMDKYETTNEEYAEFVKATGHAAPGTWNGGNIPAGQAQFPVTGVSHTDATAYAKWKGKMLPTESQFFRAFRGDKSWLYPWGNQWHESWVVCFDNDAYTGLAKVTASPKDVSPFGVFNLAGNATELLRDPNPDGAFFAHGATFQAGDPLRCMPSNYTLLLNDSARDISIGFRCVTESK